MTDKIQVKVDAKTGRVTPRKPDPLLSEDR